MTPRLFPRFAIIGLLFMAGCSDGQRGAGEKRVVKERSVGTAKGATASSGFGFVGADDAWKFVSSGSDVALVFPASGPTTVRLSCPAGRKRIMINVPSFRRVASEERLTFGSGGAVEALVADTRGNRLRGGVSATGPVPGDLMALIGGPVSASYGAQRIGPIPAPPGSLARDFSAACDRPVPSPSTIGASACLTQDGERFSLAPLRGVGTEPFWAVQIEGRCVTYSHPEDQQGTRVWTRYEAGATGGIWTGALGGHPFILRTRAQPGCSDGMSDRRYPLALDLTIGGEQRSGCAEPR